MMFGQRHYEAVAELFQEDSDTGVWATPLLQVRSEKVLALSCVWAK